MYNLNQNIIYVNFVNLTLKALNLFEMIINVLVSSFRFIWIPMLWVYDNYTKAHSYSAEIFRRQNLTSTDVDPRAVRVKGRDSHTLSLYKN